jgi:tRNA G10  N-methylase Trm11
MLPPKLAQIMINLALGSVSPDRLSEKWKKYYHDYGRAMYGVLDPFCGTGVILQEALMMGYSAYGTDVEPRMIDYTKRNIQWLVRKYPEITGSLTLDIADATKYQWLRKYSCVVSEAYLGRPLGKLPDEDTLTQIISNTNTIIKKFLINLRPQLPSADYRICLAVPAWRRPNGQLIELPLIDQLTDMGYNYCDLKCVRREDLVYFREDQVVARRLLRLKQVNQ